MPNPKDMNTSSLRVVEGSTPSNPTAGSQRIFIDSADHKAKVVNSSGAVTNLGNSDVADFTDLADTPSDYSGDSGKFVKVNGTEDGLEFDAVAIPANFTDLSDVPTSYSGEASKLVAVKGDETGLEFVASGSATAFTDLSDAPSDYTGNAGNVVRVNGTEDGLEFAAPAAGGGGAACLFSTYVNDDNGTSDPHTYATYSIPANTVSNDGDRLEITVVGSFGGSTPSEMRLYYDGVQFSTHSITPPDVLPSNDFIIKATLALIDSVAVGYSMLTLSELTDFPYGVVNTSLPSVDFSSTNNLVIEHNNGGGNNQTSVLVITVDFIPGPTP